MGFDPRKSTSARVLNYLQGGKDSFSADEKLAREMLSIAPDTKSMVWFSRQFLVGAVRLAAEAGVRQFLDLGAGMPFEPTVHETAQAIHPDARVVYVDFDPVAVAHWDGLYSGTPGVSALLGDVCRPDEILDEVVDRALLDLGEPVAVLLIGVLPFIADEEDPVRILARFRDRIAPGSYLVATHSGSESNPELLRHISAATSQTAHPIVFRPAEQVAAFFAGFELIDPGVATIQEWLDPSLPATGLVTHGAVGIKPGADAG
ncbi:SAM-dependent methyltransferase [Nocardia sp. IFM 10818]